MAYRAKWVQLIVAFRLSTRLRRRPLETRLADAVSNSRHPPPRGGFAAGAKSAWTRLAGSGAGDSHI